MARTQGTSWQSSTGRNLGFTPYDNLKRRKYTYQRTTSDLVSNQNGSQENEDDDNEWDSEDPRSRSDESALPPKVKSLVVQPILDIQKIENFCCSSEQLFKEHKEWFNQLSPNHSADNMIFLEIQRAFSEDDPESDTQYSENEMALVEWPTYKGLQGGLPTIGLRMFDMKVPPYYVPHYPTWFRQIEMTRIREYDPEFTGEVVTRWPRRGKEGFEEAQFLASKQLYKVIRTAMRLIHARYKIRGMKTLRAQDHRPFSQNQGEPRCICNQPIRRYGGEQEGVERCIDPQCKVGRYHYKCLSENELNNVVTYDWFWVCQRCVERRVGERFPELVVKDVLDYRDGEILVGAGGRADGDVQMSDLQSQGATIELAMRREAATTAAFLPSLPRGALPIRRAPTVRGALTIRISGEAAGVQAQSVVQDSDDESIGEPEAGISRDNTFSASQILSTPGSVSSPLASLKNGKRARDTSPTLVISDSNKHTRLIDAKQRTASSKRRKLQSSRKQWLEENASDGDVEDCNRDLATGAAVQIADVVDSKPTLTPPVAAVDDPDPSRAKQQNIDQFLAYLLRIANRIAVRDFAADHMKSKVSSYTCGNYIFRTETSTGALLAIGLVPTATPVEQAALALAMANAGKPAPYLTDAEREAIEDWDVFGMSDSESDVAEGSARAPLHPTTHAAPVDPVGVKTYRGAEKIGSGSSAGGGEDASNPVGASGGLDSRILRLCDVVPSDWPLRALPDTTNANDFAVEVEEPDLRHIIDINRDLYAQWLALSIDNADSISSPPVIRVKRGGRWIKPWTPAQRKSPVFEHYAEVVEAVRLVNARLRVQEIERRDEDPEAIYCRCRKEGDGKSGNWHGCEDQSCANDWYHEECLSVDELKNLVTSPLWVCSHCVTRRDRDGYPELGFEPHTLHAYRNLPISTPNHQSGASGEPTNSEVRDSEETSVSSSLAVSGKKPRANSPVLATEESSYRDEAEVQGAGTRIHPEAEVQQNGTKDEDSGDSSIAPFSGVGEEQVPAELIDGSEDTEREISFERDHANLNEQEMRFALALNSMPNPPKPWIDPLSGRSIIPRTTGLSIGKLKEIAAQQYAVEWSLNEVSVLAENGREGQLHFDFWHTLIVNRAYYKESGEGPVGGPFITVLCDPPANNRGKGNFDISVFLLSNLSVVFLEFANKKGWNDTNLSGVVGKIDLRNVCKYSTLEKVLPYLEGYTMDSEKKYWNQAEQNEYQAANYSFACDKATGQAHHEVIWELVELSAFAHALALEELQNLAMFGLW